MPLADPYKQDRLREESAKAQAEKAVRLATAGEFAEACEAWDVGYAYVTAPHAGWSTHAICMNLLTVTQSLNKPSSEETLMEILLERSKHGAEEAEAKGGVWTAFYDRAYARLILSGREDLAHQVLLYFQLNLHRDWRCTKPTTLECCIEWLLESWLTSWHGKNASADEVAEINQRLYKLKKK